MEALFYISAVVAVAATTLALSRRDAVHGLLYLIVSLLAVALVFFALGAPFAAALEVIIYAGAIVVLFLFAVMLLDLGRAEEEQRIALPSAWIGPAALAAVLLGELIFIVLGSQNGLSHLARRVPPDAVGRALFGPYLIAVELASMLLLAALVAAWRLGTTRRGSPDRSGG